MLMKIDTWIGKHLFIPPIIKICQITKSSQYVVGTYCFILALVLVVLFWKFDGYLSIALFIFNCVVASVWVFRAARFQYATLRSKGDGIIGRFWGYFGIALVVWHFRHRDIADLRMAIESILILACFFAMDITTIPPAKTKEKKTKASLAPQSIQG